MNLDCLKNRLMEKSIHQEKSTHCQMKQHSFRHDEIQLQETKLKTAKRNRNEPGWRDLDQHQTIKGNQRSNLVLTKTLHFFDTIQILQYAYPQAEPQAHLRGPLQGYAPQTTLGEEKRYDWEQEFCTMLGAGISDGRGVTMIQWARDEPVILRTQG